MDRIRFINHKGAKILHLDISRIKVSELESMVEEAKKVIASQPLNSVLTLTDTTETDVSGDVNRVLKDFTTHNKPYVRAGAVLGVTGLKKVILNTIVTITGRNLQAFDDTERAKDWLSTQ